MKAKFRLISIGLAVVSLVNFTSCGGEEDFGGMGPVCAGCDDTTPWSVVGSENCYYDYDECVAAENGTCALCN